MRTSKQESPELHQKTCKEYFLLHELFRNRILRQPPHAKLDQTFYLKFL